ncbi:MAG: thioredoxin-disulfide reductase [Ignavibacteriales bacterium]|nr:MAG: thioredoxin-disulfide reductase [Ignavibacteriales bacterium]
MSNNHHKVIIIGSGPAGFTAALYTGRANLNPVIFEGMQPGGQLTITTEVENYPGFEHGIQGPELMDVMRKQVQRFGATSIYKEVVEVDFSKRPFTVKTYDDVHTADAIIISTGASAKLIGLESESKYMGYGVSACATCDGFFFKGLKVIVVGGGDTAMEEANFLTKFASEVTIIHRRDEFRASKIMFERAQKNPKIKFLTNKVVKEVVGAEENGRKTMTGVILQDTVDGSTSELKADGLFIGIGHQPNTKLFKGIIDMDETGYLLTKSGSTYTNIEGVFAAGDVADKTYRQAITAAGSGCMAALDCERWLEAQEG